MIRDIHVRLDRTTWPNGRPPRALSKLAGLHQLDVLQIMLHTALWTRPPRVYGFDLSDLWAWMRYGAAFSARQHLRLREEWSELDPHQKTILSDDMGVGSTTLFLVGALKCIEYVNTNHALASALPGRFRILSRAKRGPSKTPDYVARLPKNGFAVLECKGSQTSVRALESAINDGRAQKQNIAAQSGTTIRHSLVGGLFVPQWRSRDDATLIIADPDRKDLTQTIREVSTEALELAIVQLATSKHLALAGMWSAANMLATHPLAELQTISDPFRQALDRLPSEGSRLAPFAGDETIGQLGALEFRFDVSPLTSRLREGRSVLDALGSIAKLSRAAEWQHASSRDDKTARVRTPYDVELALSIDFERG